MRCLAHSRSRFVQPILITIVGTILLSNEVRAIPSAEFTLTGLVNFSRTYMCSSLFVNDSSTTFVPSFSGTNNFQFFGAKGLPGR